MEKKAHLLLAQVDHASGEVLGFAVERIMGLGAHNVQLIPTITKKNRPGHLLLIDTTAAKEEAIAAFLIQELKVTGYHRVDTTHIFYRVAYAARKVTLRMKEKVQEFQCAVKLVGEPGQPLCMDVEHDFLVNVQTQVKEKMNCLISLSELRTMIESKLRESDEEVTIEI
ncbi:MAG: nickel insertion protein [Thermodesulfovibrionales bacterium]